MSTTTQQTDPPRNTEEDDEPDDWYVKYFKIYLLMRSQGAKSGTSESSAQAAPVNIHFTLPGTRGADVTGRAVENTKLNDCYYEKKDWRACKNEVCINYYCIIIQ